MKFSELPLEWQQKISKLRAENARYRVERNQARDALAALALKVASQ